MSSGIARRIERELSLPGLFEGLANRLAASDLRSLLVETFRDRAGAVKPSSVVAQNPLLAPSTVSARVLLAFDVAAFQAAPAFDAVDLSPVCPFGASHALGGASQNNVLTTIRNAEVLADSTIAMAIEAARRRHSGELVRLCASTRLIRLQPFEGKGFSPHFRLFGAVTAGRDVGAFRFETEQLVEHVRVYLQLFRLLNGAGFRLERPLVELTDMTAAEAALTAAGVKPEEIQQAIRAHRAGGSERFLAERGIDLPADAKHPLLESGVTAVLRGEFPEAEFRVNQRRLEGMHYYRTFALRISPQAPDGVRYPVADGGFTDWTARLLGNRKERLLISGIGSEFLCKMYREPARS
jgi:hypothetical protein